jgi:hypothetical protein
MKAAGGSPAWEAGVGVPKKRSGVQHERILGPAFERAAEGSVKEDPSRPACGEGEEGREQGCRRPT